MSWVFLGWFLPLYPLVALLVPRLPETHKWKSKTGPVSDHRLTLLVPKCQKMVLLATLFMVPRSSEITQNKYLVTLKRVSLFVSIVFT
uniref:Secreted protein n=1 Tax=Gasterosteus aculeatus aculeatus TaxID=481459 RepID=A0AAQ4RF05_GASAC